MLLYLLVNQEDGFVEYSGLYKTKEEAIQRKSKNEVIFEVQPSNDSAKIQYLLIKSFGLLFESAEIHEHKNDAIKSFEKYTSVSYSLINDIDNGNSDVDKSDLLGGHDQTFITEIEL